MQKIITRTNEEGSKFGYYILNEYNINGIIFREFAEFADYSDGYNHTWDSFIPLWLDDKTSTKAHNIEDLYLKLKNETAKPVQIDFSRYNVSWNKYR